MTCIKKKIFIRFAALWFVAVSLAGPFALSSRSAQAQVCVISGQICSMIEDMTQSIAQQGTFTGVNAAIQAALSALLNSLVNSLTVPSLQQIINQAWSILSSLLTNIIQGTTNPAMMDMARQWTANLLDAVNLENLLEDAKAQIEALKKLQNLEFEANVQIGVSPGNICTYGTAMGAGGRMESIRIFYRRALNNEQAAETGNSTGSSAEQGPSQDAEAKTQDQQNLFCDPDQLDGRVPCNVPAGAETEWTDADVQPAYTVLNKENIDVGDPNAQKAVKAVTDMVIEPVTKSEPTNTAALPDSTAHVYTVMKRAYIARQQTLYDAINETVASRVPGSGASAINGLRSCAGPNGNPSACSSLPADRTDPNFGLGGAHDPSYREVLRALVKERWWNPARLAEFSDSYAQARREMASVEALNLIQQQDYYELMERLALLLAVQVSLEIDQLDRNDTKTAGAAPVIP